jgi:hypothetical protein
VRVTTTSSTKLRVGIAPTTKCGSSVVGRSFNECTARSISFVRKHSSSSAVNNPFPPMRGIGAVLFWFLSPEVMTCLSSTLKPGNAAMSCALMNSLCHRARGLFRVPMTNRFRIRTYSTQSRPPFPTTGPRLLGVSTKRVPKRLHPPPFHTSSLHCHLGPSRITQTFQHVIGAVVLAYLHYLTPYSSQNPSAKKVTYIRLHISSFSNAGPTFLR